MKIAFCTTCRGRTPHLIETVVRNIADNPGPDSAFVLLDYGSEDGMADFILGYFHHEIESGKIVYYRTEADGFKMAHAKNMAHRCAMREGADVLVNLDADNLTGPGFADYVRQTFERTKKDPQEIFLWSRMIHGAMPRGITGRIAVTKNAFLISGGYDEKYETHSPDDKDFNLRLRRLGYCAQEIDPRHLRALNHNDKMRFKEYPHVRDLDATAAICQVARVVNNGRIGCGTVFRNFDSAPIDLGPVPTRLFGVGMHKTGTRSLHIAFRTLGYKSGHWENAHWVKAVWMEMHHQSRSATLERFYAVVDTPIPQLYKQLDQAYPGSKFVLTVRDDDEWLESVWKHFDTRFNPHAHAWDTDPFTHRIHRHIYGRETFEPSVFLAAYRRHNDEVEAYFKDRPGDLLVMNMSRGDGWNELCRFLGVPAPSIPYPVAGVTTEIAPPDTDRSY